MVAAYNSNVTKTQQCIPIKDRTPYATLYLKKQKHAIFFKNRTDKFNIHQFQSHLVLLSFKNPGRWIAQACVDLQ